MNGAVSRQAVNARYQSVFINNIHEATVYDEQVGLRNRVESPLDFES